MFAPCPHFAAYLNRHKLIHGSKELLCPHCPYVSNRKEALETHISAQHDNQRHLCPAGCGYSTGYTGRGRYHGLVVYIFLIAPDRVNKSGLVRLRTSLSVLVEQLNEHITVLNIIKRTLWLWWSRNIMISIDTSLARGQLNYLCNKCDTHVNIIGTI